MSLGMINSVFLQHRFSSEAKIPALDDFRKKKMKGAKLRCEKQSGTALHDEKVTVDRRPQKPVLSDGIGIARFITGKVFFVTGATGFLAKVLVEKILRTIPDVGKIYLLINAEDKQAAMERLKKEIINTDLFKHMHQCQGTSHQAFLLHKLVPVAGNLCKPELGIEVGIADIIADEVDIIVNSAADTTFDQRYDAALDVNTLGPCRLSGFAKRCKKLKLFVHVSTAYVNGQRQGIIPEKQFKLGDSIAREIAAQASPETSFPSLNVEAEIKMALDTRAALQHDKVTKKMKFLGLERARTFGWTDTYTFTKAMGEMMLESERGDIPVVIIRPSIIESTYREPFPGWIEGIRMADPLIVSYGKGQLTGFAADAKTIVDVIPADMVVNTILAATVKHATTTKPGLPVYHVASSVVNPLEFEEMFSYFFEYFDSSPHTDNAGNPIMFESVKLFNSMNDFESYSRTKNLPRIVQHLANIYEPYCFYKGRFDNSNTEKLLEEMSEEEKKSFGFDVKNVNWKTYWCDIHIPGLMTYALKVKQGCN